MRLTGRRSRTLPSMIQKLGLKQPANITVRSLEEAVAAAQKIGYPLVVRRLMCLGGRAMEIVYNEEELETLYAEAVQVSDECPVLLDHFPEVAQSRWIWML